MTPGSPLVDPGGLAAFLAEHRPELAGPFRVERLGEGQSCLTFLVSGDGWEVVLRRPPRGELTPGAYDVAREHRVLSALVGSGAPVPVPRPLAMCPDPAVIGAPFYLMDHVPGAVVRTVVPPAFAAPQERRRMGEALVDVMAALHALDPVAAGLEGFGRPTGYLERQVRRMGDQWQRARSRDVPEVEAVGAWLAAHRPESGPACLVHGDLKLDNVILAPDPPARVAAVIDWELSTLGDPLADLGWMLYFWREPGEPPFGIPVTNATDQPGFSRRSELAARYAAATGADLSRLRWYVALAGWKIAVIMEGAYRRHLAGEADHASYAALDVAVPGLARRALAAAEGDLPL